MFLFISGTALCQDTTKQTNQKIAAFDPPVNDVYTYVEQMPEFKGGQQNLNNYLATTLKYPKEAKQALISGTVYIRFVVNADGKISNVEVMKGIGYGCDEEALRVVRNMPDWTPGMQNHKKIRCYYNLPVKFKL